MTLVTLRTILQSCNVLHKHLTQQENLLHRNIFIKINILRAYSIVIVIALRCVARDSSQTQSEATSW